MRYLITTVLLTLLAPNAQADLVLRWSPTSQSSVGTPIVVDLFLDETGTTFIQDFGVSGASYIVTHTGVGSLRIPIENFNFDDGVDPTSSMTMATVVQTSILGVTSPSGSLNIGTFTIDPTSFGTGSLSISLLNPGTPGDFTVYQNGSFDQLVLDNTDTIIRAPTFQYTFSAVPEPSSAWCLALVAVPVTLSRCRGIVRLIASLRQAYKTSWKCYRCCHCDLVAGGRHGDSRHGTVRPSR
ncbi:MAG: hypothetical protein R3E01_36550 [Pirellulaceae bacterium]|nr:hypothetical protein [Planctomycetales bacterium]